MKAKRWISLLLAVSMMLGVLAMPASAAAQQPESTAVVSEELPDAAELSAAEDENDIVNIRIRATGNLVYGSDYKLEVETRPENTQYIAVVLGTSGEAYGYVTLMISDKLRTLLKLIPLPKKMSQTPDQAEEFNVYSYLKQLIDGNDVSVLLRVADEAVSVMDVLHFYVPTIDQVSNGLRLALNLIRKYLPEGAFSRIYLDEQPVDAGNYVAGALALESSDMNTAGFAMFKIKPSRPKSPCPQKSCRASMKRLCWKWMVRWCPPIRSATATRSPAGAVMPPASCPQSRAPMCRRQRSAAITPAARSAATSP